MQPRRAHEHLPPLLNEIADVLGIDAAIRLADAVGGTRIYIPFRPVTEAHGLAKLIGKEAAARLQEQYGGGAMDIPLGPHSRSFSFSAVIASLHDLELSTGQIARILKVSQRTVFRHLARHRSAAAKLINYKGSI